jgi:hypothetical protein
VAHLKADRLLKSRKAFLDLVPLATKGIRDVPPSAFHGIESLQDYLYDMVLARQQFAHNSSDIYLDALNIITHHSWLAIDDKGKLMSCVEFDIVANDVATKNSAPREAYRKRLTQGVIDTNAEALTLIRSIPCEVTNTAELFQKTSLTGKGWLVLRGVSDPSLKQARLTPDAKTRITKSLEEGYMIVLPADSSGTDPPLTWWRIDPRTGHTLGIGPQGRGGGFTEYVVENSSGIVHLSMIFCFVGTLGAMEKSQHAGQMLGNVIAMGVCLVGGAYLATVLKPAAMPVILYCLASIATLLKTT